MHLEAVFVYKTWGRSVLPMSSNRQPVHRFSICFMSTLIGANDSHIALSMNSYGATTILSSKAKLGWLP